MSQSHEPSYYEIALTNRQVLIVFVVLLVCVVVAFFSGVWVGQRDAPGTLDQVAQTEVAEEENAAEEGAAIGELHFFADEDREKRQETAPAQNAATPQSETTLLEDLGGEEAEPDTPEPPRQEAASPVAKPPASEAAPTTGGYVIQVFSSADEEQARRLLQRLKDAGFPAFLSPVEVGSQTMMRVRIGPFGALPEAETVAERIRREFKLDTWVTH